MGIPVHHGAEGITGDFDLVDGHGVIGHKNAPLADLVVVAFKLGDIIHAFNVDRFHYFSLSVTGSVTRGVPRPCIIKSLGEGVKRFDGTLCFFNNLPMPSSLEISLLTEIREEQKTARDERQKQSIMLTEIHTVLMGPEQHPDIGLVAIVANNGRRITRIEKFLLWGGGAGVFGGGGWAALKSFLPWVGGHG